VGVWRRAIGAKQLTVTVTLLAELSADECDALAAEADAIGRFFGLAADLRIVRS
jgi:hypothetical protein